MNFQIKTLSGFTFCLSNVSESASTRDIFLLVAIKTQCAAHQVRLLYKRKLVDEWDTSKLVSECVDVNEDPIVLHFTNRLGMSPTNGRDLEKRTCPICLEETKALFVTKPCAHVHCHTCCVKLARLQSKCSVCRTLVEAYVHISCAPKDLEVFPK